MQNSIRAFYAQHYPALDDGDIGAWVADFAPDATLVAAGTTEPVHGTSAIAALSTAAHERRVAAGVRLRHISSMLAVIGDKDGHHVRARSYVLVVRTPREQPSALWASTVCEDELVWDESRWRIRSRRVTLDAPLGDAAAPPAAPTPPTTHEENRR